MSKLSPTHSEVEEPITLKAIDGEDVQALAIKENDLKKVFVDNTKINHFFMK